MNWLDEIENIDWRGWHHGLCPEAVGDGECQCHVKTMSRMVRVIRGLAEVVKWASKTYRPPLGETRGAQRVPDGVLNRIHDALDALPDDAKELLGENNE